ncbi:hypothetical protein ACHAXH_008325 [Discostella pseudostelligera]
MSFHAAASSSHYSRYDDDLNSDEEEEERRLSEQHGEAADDDGNNDGASSRKRGRRQANTTLTEEDAAAAKEFEEKIRSKAKKARPSLQPMHLKSAKGLLYVRRAFPTLVKKNKSTPAASTSFDSSPVRVSGTNKPTESLAHKLSTQSQINAAAKYSRSLMSAYREFAHELFPSLAAEDVFLKIEDLGSKKEVKDYLQLMRDEFRKEYLEGIYGVEKAARLLNELEHGLKVHQNPMEEENGENYYGASEHRNVVPRLGHAVTNEDGDDEENITPPPPATTRMTPMAANPYAATPLDVAETTNVTNDFALNHRTDRIIADARDEAEDEEATFSMDKANNNADQAEAAEENVGETNAQDAADLDTFSEAREHVIDENRDVDGLGKKDAVLGDQINVEKNDVDYDKTQETLTLVESQFDDPEMDATQDDDRFSQPGVDMGCDEEVEMNTKSVVGDASSQAAEDSTLEEEENTADDRFSQFTQGTGIIFEEEEGASENDDNNNCDLLGQPTQLSMEY